MTDNDERRDIRTTVRLSKAERAAVEEAARRAHRVLSDWMRLQLLDAAKEDSDE